MQRKMYSAFHVVSFSEGGEVSSPKPYYSFFTESFRTHKPTVFEGIVPLCPCHSYYWILMVRNECISHDIAETVLKEKWLSFRENMVFSRLGEIQAKMQSFILKFTKKLKNLRPTTMSLFLLGCDALKPIWKFGLKLQWMQINWLCQGFVLLSLWSPHGL